MYTSFDHQMLSSHTFGLVNASMVEQLPEGIVADPLVPSTMPASAHLMPRLISLRDIPAKLHGELLQYLYDAEKYDEQPAVSMLIQSDYDAKQFARHWNGLQLFDPQPSRKVWLRLHDPRVMHQLLRILGPVQRRHVFGRSVAFTYWIGKEWVRVDRDCADESVPSHPATPGWDWNRIEQTGIVNRALHGAGVQGATALTQQGAVAEQLIKRANERHGLTEQADLVEFAVRGLSTRSAFDEHHKIASHIRPSGDPGDDASLADRLALIDEQVWAELSQQH